MEATLLSVEQCMTEIYQVVLEVRNALVVQGEKVSTMEDLLEDYCHEDVLQLFLEDLEYTVEMRELQAHNPFYHAINAVYQKYGYLPHVN